MEKKKKRWTLLLVFCILMEIIPTAVFATEEVDHHDINIENLENDEIVELDNEEESTTVPNIHEHTLGEYQSDENFHWRNCLECGEEYLEKKEHVFNTEWISTDSSHYRVCACGKKIDEAAHISNEPATTEKAETCVTCGYEIAPKLEHIHNYVTLKSDSVGHWYECICGDKKDNTAHTSSGPATTEKAEICTICQYEIAPKLEHIHDYVTLKSDSTGHWYECICGDKKDNTAHTSSGPATTEKAEICTICQYEIAPKLEHTHTYSKLVSDSTNHWYECSCGEKSGVEAHNGGVASCQSKAKCKICGNLYGNISAHNYNIVVYHDRLHWFACDCGVVDESTRKAHVFDNGCDAKCNVCSYTRAVAHDYKWYVIDDNNHVKKCANCSIEVNGTKTVHNFKNACSTRCETCGYERTITHVYSSECDTTCNVCSVVRKAPKGHSYQFPCSSACSLCKASRPAGTYGHDFNKLGSDATGHWKLCACGTKGDLEKHKSSGSATEEKAEVCTICDYIIAPKLNHKHNIETVFSYDSTYHFYKCTSCDEQFEKVEHVYDNDCDTLCDLCGYERVIEHVYSSECDELCNICNEKRKTNTKHSLEWKYNNEVHWQYCVGCEIKTTKSQHSFLTDECFTCGYKNENASEDTEESEIPGTNISDSNQKKDINMFWTGAVLFIVILDIIIIAIIIIKKKNDEKNFYG